MNENHTPDAENEADASAKMRAPVSADAKPAVAKTIKAAEEPTSAQKIIAPKETVMAQASDAPRTFAAPSKIAAAPEAANASQEPVIAEVTETTSDETPAEEKSVVAETRQMPITAPRAVVPEGEVEAQMRRMSRRSFLWGAAALGGGYGGWCWLISRRTEDGVPWPFRRALQTNGELSRDLFSEARLAPTFSKSRVSERVNGDIGLGEFDAASWRLQVAGLADGDGTKELTLHDIQALPRVEMTTELKCIEGWSIIVNWAGARLSDFMAKYPPATLSGNAPDVFRKPNDLPDYIGMATPDQAYYVGLDLESALHPQTLLCYEMNGAPLTSEHGAPLRLAIPVKYGIKNIKRIGSIHFTNLRPADYWAEQGYDWYAGH